MKKQLVIFGIVTILVTVGFSGCTSSTEEKPTPGQVVDKEKFLGTWYGYFESECCGSKNITIIFYSSGNVDWGDSLLYTFRVEGDTLYIGFGEYSYEEDGYSYFFNNDYTTLTLSFLTSDPENDATYYLNKQ